MCLVPVNAKRVLDSLGLELWEVVSHYGAGNQAQVLCKSSKLSVSIATATMSPLSRSTQVWGRVTSGSKDNLMQGKDYSEPATIR